MFSVDNIQRVSHEDNDNNLSWFGDESHKKI